MAGGGRISLLIESPLTTLAHAMLQLEPDVKKQINKATKAAATPIWQESTRAQTSSRLQVRLADSARVGVTAQNVFLRAGAIGVLSSGTPIDRIAKPIEFGANPATPVATRSRTGTPYTRRLGPAFGRPRRGGYVAHPAFREAVGRLASAWVQTARRSVHEFVEKAARNG